jgi:hypothetical protein
MNLKTALLIPLLTATLVPARAASRQETLVLYVANSKVGTLTALDEPTPDGWRLTRSSEMEIKRGSATLRLSSKSVCTVGKDLSMRSFEYVRDEASGRLLNQGESQCEKASSTQTCTVRIRTSLGGATEEKTLQLPRLVTCGAAEELRIREQLRDGANANTQTLVEELGSVQPMHWRVQKETSGFVVHSTLGAGAMSVHSIEYLDASGRTVRAEMPQMNAVALPYGSPPPEGAQSNALDVLARSTWKGPELPEGVKLVRFELKSSTGDLGAVVEDRRQKVVARSRERMVVEVRREAGGAAEKLTDEDRKRALAATPYEPLSDERIVKAARVAKSEARTPKEIVRNVTLYVHKLVRTKSLSRAYAPATATLESREGDCTEHSVLASALLKANGVPARLADGVIAFDGNLGYHEWVEAYLEGEGWVPVDPTFGEPEAGPNRVKFITGSSDPADLMAMGLSAAQAFRGLNVAIQHFEE